MNVQTSQNLRGLSVAAGAHVTFAAGGNKTLLIKALSVANGGTLDLADNDLLLDYTGASPYAQVQQYVIDGRNSGTSGILSAPGAGDVVLGVLDNSQFGRTSWNGQAIDATTVIGKYTFFGPQEEHRWRLKEDDAFVSIARAPARCNCSSSTGRATAEYSSLSLGASR